MTAVLHPPRHARWKRLRRDYFGTLTSALITIASVAILLALAGWVLNWAVLDATFSATATQADCAVTGGACWSVIAVRWRVILFGIYPYAEQWRPALACIVVAAVIILSCLPRMWSIRRLALIWVLGTGIFWRMS